VTSSDGQATVETALTLPIVLIALLLIVQVGIVVRDAMALTQAAREGARAAAVSASDDDATTAIARSAGPLAADRIVIGLFPPEGERRRGDAVTVQLAYEERLSIPIVSRIVALDLPLRATATTQLERSDVTPSPTPSPAATPATTGTPAPTTSPSPGPTP
jgi:TadE-like protein